MTDPVRRVAILVSDGEEVVEVADGEEVVEVAGSGANLEADLETAVGTTAARVSSIRRADAIVAVGTDAVSAAATDEHDVPILPIGVGRLGVARPYAIEALRALVTGRWRRTSHPTLSVTVGTDRSTRHRGAFDVTLMTAETARISEYAVSFPSGRAESFRGDGVVVATPLGSDGYAGAAGAPVLESQAGISVTPVAPFRIHGVRWVADGGVTLSIERDEEPVDLTVDGTRRGAVTPHEPIEIRVDRGFDLISVPVGREGDDAGDWKNSNESCTE